MSDESQGHHNPLANVHMPKDAAGVAALFDFGFKRFITLSVIKVLYIIGLALMVLMGLGYIGVGFAVGGVLGGIGALIVVPIFLLLNAIFFRVWLELIVVIFRIGENTTKLVEMGGGTPSGGAL